MTQVPPAELVALAEERARARAGKDFSRADELRDRVEAAGWSIVDEAGGWRLVPDTGASAKAPARRRADEVPGVVQEQPTADLSLHWVCEGWPDDIERAIAAFGRYGGSHELQYVVADVTGEPPDRWGAGIEAVGLTEGTGWAAARNAGLRRSRGNVILALDGSVEPTGDVIEPIVAALSDPTVGVVGPYGIVTVDLRDFEPAPAPGPCDAVEGYLMAFRRDVLLEVGGFDERFRWYRTADIEWSFRVKDHGYRCDVVPVPIERHEHRIWAATPPGERARLSKRNFYRFLDRWRDRWDLVLAGEPEGGSRGHEHREA